MFDRPLLLFEFCGFVRFGTNASVGDTWNDTLFIGRIVTEANDLFVVAGRLARVKAVAGSVEDDKAARWD